MWTMGECLKVVRSVFPMMLVTLIFVLDNTIDRQGPMEDSLENLKSVVKKQKETMEECQKFFHHLKESDPSPERDQEIKDKIMEV
jgi:hypothetical protein